MVISQGSHHHRSPSPTTEDAKSRPIEVDHKVDYEVDQEEEDDSRTMVCGVGSYRPQWLQHFATARFFAINFCVVGILQGAFYTFMVGIISTLEKRFAFDSTISYSFLIADNFSQMILSPLVGWLGTKVNRAHLIALGELVVAFACLLAATPYWLYGPGLHLLNREFGAANSTTGSVDKYDLCPAEAESCSALNLSDHSSSSSAPWLPVGIFFFASFANGFGYTAFYTVGLPFLDDNIPKKSAAMYLSTISTLRLLGPCLGFVLSSIVLSFYEDPLMEPGIDSQDPRWVGAWWIGFLVLWFAITLASLPMFLFPRQFRDLKSKVSTQTNALAGLSAQGLSESFRRLSRNGLLLFHIFGGVFRIIGYFGFYIIKPKYIELAFRKSASSAAFYTGAASVVTMAVGTMLGGTLITYRRPRARHLAAFIVAMELFSTLGIFTAMFFSCEPPVFSSQYPTEVSPCNSECLCTTQVYQPVCAADGATNYFSPCFAGCTHFDGALQKFGNCSCSGGVWPGTEAVTATATNGLCDRPCDTFPFFIGILSLCNLVASTARTGDTLLTLRSVDQRDKSLAMGLVGTILAVFAFIPYPIIFGRIIDATCLVWESTCGQTGNCWLYDMDRFRVYFHSTAVVFLLLGISLEVGAVVMAGSVRNLYEDEEEEEGKPTGECSTSGDDRGDGDGARNGVKLKALQYSTAQNDDHHLS